MLWKFIKELNPKNVTTSLNYIAKNESQEKPVSIANSFDNYFSSIANKLLSESPSQVQYNQATLDKYLKQRCPFKISLVYLLFWRFM